LHSPLRRGSQASDPDHRLLLGVLHLARRVTCADPPNHKLGTFSSSRFLVVIGTTGTALPSFVQKNVAERAVRASKQS
jgi:hypothetical protein